MDQGTPVMRGLDIEGLLSAHVRECADEWCAECLCGWLVPEDANDFTAAHRAHVAAVLREQIDGALAEAWERGHEVCEWPACTKNHRNPYRAAHLSDTERAGDAE